MAEAEAPRIHKAIDAARTLAELQGGPGLKLIQQSDRLDPDVRADLMKAYCERLKTLRPSGEPAPRLSKATGDAVDRILERALKNGPFDAEKAELADQAKRRNAALKWLGMDHGRRYRAEVVALDKYQIYHHDQRQVVERLTSLLLDLPAFVNDGQGLIFYGPCGTGKDHLLACMLYAAAGHGLTARWINGRELAGQFRDRIDTGRRDEDQFRELSQPQVLGISDPTPPVGDLGEWNTDNLYRLLDRRYSDQKSTWVSMNAANLEEADAKLSTPVYERFRHDAEILECFWPSFRERKRGRRPT